MGLIYLRGGGHGGEGLAGRPPSPPAAAGPPTGPPAAARPFTGSKTDVRYPFGSKPTVGPSSGSHSADGSASTGGLSPGSHSARKSFHNAPPQLLQFASTNPDRFENLTEVTILNSENKKIIGADRFRACSTLVTEIVDKMSTRSTRIGGVLGREVVTRMHVLCGDISDLFLCARREGYDPDKRFPHIALC